MTIALPDITVAELEAGFVELSKGITYHVAERQFASAYLAETGPFFVEVYNREPVAVPLGGHCSVPSGVAHQLFVDPDDVRTMVQNLRPPFARSPGNGEGTIRLFAAIISKSVNPLPEIVPDVFVLSQEQMAEMNGLDQIFRLLRDSIERDQVRSSITFRLAEIVAISLLDHLLQMADDDEMLATAKISDIQIRRALHAMHAAPDQEWTLERLARHAGMSRSVLAERFKQLMGHAPMEYLTRIRISRAMRLLKANDVSLSEIAFSSGYGSDAAFYKAFKRMTGTSPGTYRRLNAGPAVADENAEQH